MRLKHVLIENVCQFRRLDHTFHPGLTGIIGPNGSGKSNFTKALFFALTGAYRNAGVKADNVCQLAEGRRSAVTLRLEHDGVALEVARFLAGGRTWLKVNDSEEVLGDTAVTEKLMEVLGVDVRLLGEYVFVLQLHMADFIEATAGDRAKVFQRLFGTDECEAVHSFISKVLDKELVLLAEADLAEVRARRVATEARMAALLDWLEDRDHEVQSAEAAAASARALLDEADRAEAAARELGRVEIQLNATRVELGDAERARDAAEGELTGLETALRAAASDAQAARVALATWRMFELRRARTRRLAIRRSQLEREALEHPRPAEAREPTATEREQLDQYRVDRDRLGRRRDLVATGQATCPTCGQPITQLESLADLEARLADLDSRIEALEDLFDRHHMYQVALAGWESWAEQHRRALVELHAEERALAEEGDGAPDVDQAALERVVNAEAGLAEAIAKLRRRRDAGSHQAAAARGRLDQLQARADELAAERDRYAVAEPNLAAARATLARLDDLKGGRQRAEGEADALARTLEADDAALARLAEAEAHNAAIRRLRAGAQRVAEVTHRTAAPRLVSESHLGEMVDDVDDLLELFGVDFLVRLGEDLGFVADFADGRSQAAPRLSEGQKSVLALAFWVAVNFLFARKVGFLSLDEPTSSLDQQNLGAVAVALGRLRELSESLGLQCLLVTHEPSLAGLFDSVLQL